MGKIGHQSMLRIKRRGEVERRVLGPDVMLYKPGRGEVHVLNATSAYVWDLLAVGRDAGEVESALREAFAVPAAADVGADVARVLAEFRAADLVDSAD